MKRIIYIILCLAAVCACETEFDIEKQMGPGSIFVKFLPSNNYTDGLSRMMVQATTSLKDAENPAKTRDEEIRVNIDGSPLNMSKDPGMSAPDSCQTYATDHVFKPGEKITVEVSIPGRGTVHSTTTVPQYFPECTWKTSFKEDSDDYSEGQLCIEIDYDNAPGNSGYYGVGVYCESHSTIMRGEAHSQTGTIKWFEDNTYDIEGGGFCHGTTPVDFSIASLGQEHLEFNPLRTLFGYNNRDFLKGEAVLAWMDAPGSGSDTGHHVIWVRADRDFEGEYLPDDSFWELDKSEDHVLYASRRKSEYRYKLIFYSFDYGSYSYMKARENENYDVITQMGLAPTSYTFTNIIGGTGVCGSYLIRESDWFKIDAK